MSRSPAGCYSIGESPSLGCGVGCVVGAEALGQAAGVWVKTHFYRKGPYLCATVYSVAAGTPRIIDLRVDLRPIERALVRAHAVQHSRESLKNPHVGWSLGSMWKKAKSAAKSIGRAKLVKGVVGVTKAVYKGAKKVVKSKITGVVLGVASAFPLTAPFAAPALAAYAAANTAVATVEKGAKVVKVAQSALGTISRGKKLATAVGARAQVTAAAVKTAGALMPPAQKQAAAARAKAASVVKLSPTAKAQLVAKAAAIPLAARAKLAAQTAAKLKAASIVRQRVALAQSLPPNAKAQVLATTALQIKAAPEIAKAKALEAKLADPKVKQALVKTRDQASVAQGLLEDIQRRATTATGKEKLDAQKSAVIVDLVARNRARIQAMSQANAGGLPGLLITPEGKLVRGKFRVKPVATAPTRGALLYQGRGDASRGTFTRISGEPPLDGVRMMGAGAAAHDIGPYEVEGCGGGCGCANCSA